MVSQEKAVGRSKIEGTLQKVLLGGVLAATALFVIGIVTLLMGSSHPDLAATESLGNILASVKSLDPMGLIGLGVIIVVLTPLIRIAMTAVYFLDRDRLLTVVPIVVLALIILSFVLKTHAG